MILAFINRSFKLMFLIWALCIFDKIYQFPKYFPKIHPTWQFLLEYTNFHITSHYNWTINYNWTIRKLLIRMNHETTTLMIDKKLAKCPWHIDVINSLFTCNMQSRRWNSYFQTLISQNMEIRSWVLVFLKVHTRLI